MAESGKAESKKKRVPRREFLVGGGVALAAGAIGVCAPEAAVAAVVKPVSADVSYPVLASGLSPFRKKMNENLFSPSFELVADPFNPLSIARFVPARKREVQAFQALCGIEVKEGSHAIIFHLMRLLP